MLFMTLSVIVAAAGCGDKASESQPEYTERITNVETFTITPTEYREYITLPVVVIPNREVNLGLTGGGKATVIHVDKGDRVGKDMVLLETDDILLKAQYENARATYEYQKNEFARSEKLYREGSITAAAHDAATLQLAQAENANTMAKKQLEDAVLKAPFSGIVTSRSVEVGDILGIGSPAFRIIDISRVKVQAGIPEKYIGDFAEGNTVSIEFDSLPGKAFEGKIGYVSPEANTSVRTFLAEIVVDNSTGLLRSGIMGNARILRKIFENALLAPINAAIETQNGSIVFVAGENDIVEERRIVIGSGNDTMIMLLSGVSPGERIIAKGQHDLVAGEKVNITGTYTVAAMEDSGL